MSSSLLSSDASITSEVSKGNSLPPLSFLMLVSLPVTLVSLIAAETACNLGFHLEICPSFLRPDQPPNRNEMPPQLFFFLEIRMISA